MSSPVLGEFAGTFILIVLGDGVVAGVLLKRSKSENAGWMAITTGWALAVMAGVFTALAFGSPDAHLNPAVTLGAAVATGDFSEGRCPTARRKWPARSWAPWSCGCTTCRIGRLTTDARCQAGRVLQRSGRSPRRGQPHERDHRHVRAGAGGHGHLLEPRHGGGAGARARAFPGGEPGVGDRTVAGRARPATPSTRRATSARGWRTRCCRLPASAMRTGATRRFRWRARWPAVPSPASSRRSSASSPRQTMRAPRVVRWFLKALLGLVVVLVVVLASGLVYRAWRQHRAETTMTVSAANGIDETTLLRIGNTRQWISIRGQDRRNPVVLVLHGGPGASLGAMALSFVPWERDYVVVHWDQPGAGRTFGEAGRVFDPSLTIEIIAADGTRVAEFLRSHLQQNQIILVGWSWGSALGIHMIKTRPDLFAAYFGTGQVVNMKEGEALAYARVLAKARKRGDADAVAELEQIGPPPYDALPELGVQRKWASVYEGYASNVTLLFRRAPRSAHLAGRYL